MNTHDPIDSTTPNQALQTRIPVYMDNSVDLRLLLRHATGPWIQSSMESLLLLLVLVV